MQQALGCAVLLVLDSPMGSLSSYLSEFFCDCLLCSFTGFIELSREEQGGAGRNESMLIRT